MKMTEGLLKRTFEEGTAFTLKMVSNRGTKLFPTAGAITDCVDHWRCRFLARDATASLTDAQVGELLGRVQTRFAWNHLEKLQEFDGVPGWTKAQGED